MELSRIAELARQDAGRKFYSIAHLLTTEALREAFDNLRKDAATGVDGVTCAEYEEHLVENLAKLHEKLKSKTYRAQPLRRYLHRQGGWAKETDLDPVRGEFVLTPESVCETDRDNAASKYIGEGQQARSVRKMRRRIAPA